MEPTAATILSSLTNPSITDSDRDLISRAFDRAKELHQGQKRKSGQPYFFHVYETALTLARWGMDGTTVAAGLLHDTLEDTKYSEKELTKEFGKEIAFLVSGVTKIGRIKYRGNQAQAETLKKMVLALSEDIRVVFVKLADRMHNMRTLSYLPLDKQRRIATETAEIYAPLAYRLGLGTVSGELEDMAFPFLHPEEHRSLKKLLQAVLPHGETYINRVKEKITEELAQQKISVIQIDSRVKRISSLYKKLKRHEMEIQKIHDLIALRIIVEKVEDCYAVLGLIHSLWPPLPGLIKDYIALPKPNGYRSLHTTVICLDNKPTEFQVRTAVMHHENEYGIAAHWAYHEAKGGEKKETIFADAHRLSWINQLKQWQHEINDPDEFISSLKIDFFKDRIFVITPKGEAVDLPAGATAVDFAYAIHSDIGDHCLGAKVNGRMVQLDQELQSGDAVEIITQKNKRPNEAWLNFVKTRHAKARIRSVLRSHEVLPQKTLTFVITALDRVGLVKDISSIFSTQKINLISLESSPPAHGSLVTIKAVVSNEVQNKADALALRLRSIPTVQRVNYRHN